jgi:rare lipoprotein A
MPQPAPSRPERRWPSLISSAHAETYTPPASPPGQDRVNTAGSRGRIFVQAGAFSIAENAQRIRSRVASLGNVQVVNTSMKGVELYRVRLGPIPTVEEADRLVNRLATSGYPEARVVHE